jgi:hypothetical protein
MCLNTAKMTIFPSILHVTFRERLRYKRQIELFSINEFLINYDILIESEHESLILREYSETQKISSSIEPNRIELNMSLWNLAFSIFWCFLEFDSIKPNLLHSNDLI